MDLHSDHPYWAVRSGLVNVYPPLDTDIRCDAAIVGGGVTGAILLNTLAASGVSCVVVDRRDIGYGSTSASTALLQYEIDTPLHELIGRVGKAHAERGYQLGVCAIQTLASISSGIDCGFAHRPSLLLAHNSSHLKQLECEFRARQSARLDVSWVGKRELDCTYGLRRPGAIRSAIAAELDPYRFTHGLMLRNSRCGSSIFDRTTIRSYEETKRGVILRSDRGPTITAKAVFFASGYETKEFFPRRIVQIKSTYASISEPVADLSWWGERALLWETGEPYLYARTTSDGRMIVGGEDDNIIPAAPRDRQLSRKESMLRRKFLALTGRRFEPAFRWAGPFGHTKDGLAYIGRHYAFPRAFFALGFGGNGITFSAIAAGILRDLFLGTVNRDAAIFSFER